MIQNQIELYDIIKTWIEIDYPHLKVRIIKPGGEDQQIRIFKELGGEWDAYTWYVGDIMVIYPASDNVYIVQPSLERKQPRSLFWIHIIINKNDPNYFDILSRELDKGLKNL